MERNQSGQRWYVEARDLTTNDRVDGEAANIRADVIIDSGAAYRLTSDAPLGGGAVEAMPTASGITGSGLYYFQPFAEDTDGVQVVLVPTHTTDVNIDVVARPATQDTGPRNFSLLGIGSIADGSFYDGGVSMKDIADNENAALLLSSGARSEQRWTVVSYQTGSPYDLVTCDIDLSLTPPDVTNFYTDTGQARGMIVYNCPSHAQDAGLSLRITGFTPEPDPVTNPSRGIFVIPTLQNLSPAITLVAGDQVIII